MPRKRKRGRPKLNGNESGGLEKTGASRLALTSDERKKRKRKGNEGICSTCGKFTTNIYTHKRVHDDIHPTFECDYCQKIVTNKYSLIQHFKIHFQER